MPIPVNSEALRIVLETADGLTRQARQDRDWKGWNEEDREHMLLLDTSIRMLRRSLVQFGVTEEQHWDEDIVLTSGEKAQKGLLSCPPPAVGD